VFNLDDATGAFLPLFSREGRHEKSASSRNGIIPDKQPQRRNKRSSEPSFCFPLAFLPAKTYDAAILTLLQLRYHFYGWLQLTTEAIRKDERTIRHRGTGDDGSH
jgi:hypothetical protein